jgi:hypothetical protein
VGEGEHFAALRAGLGSGGSGLRCINSGKISRSHGIAVRRAREDDRLVVSGPD